MQIRIIEDSQLSTATRELLARYRYRVFVESLGWQLAADDGMEADEFDVAHAVHVLALTRSGAMTGYARLLPTTRPYLLATHFPQLLGGAEAPNSPQTWELSRYAACDVRGAEHIGSGPTQTLVGKRVLLEAARYVAARGGREMVFCTTAPIERLAGRWGVDIRRLGRAWHDGTQRLVAAMIQCNRWTFDALSAEPVAPLASLPMPMPLPLPLPMPMPSRVAEALACA